MTSLRDWKPGDDIRDNAHHQQAVDALRPLTPLLVEPPLGIHTGRNGSTITLELPASNTTWRLAKIWEDGNATDPTDARYKVKWLDLDQSQAQSGINGKLTLVEDQIKLQDENHTTAEPWPAFATNLTELPVGSTNGGTHAIPTNTVVTCWPSYDGQGGEHWVFNMTPPPMTLKLSGDAPTGGRYKCVTAAGYATGAVTNSGALTLPETGITFGTNIAYVDNLLEKDLAVHLSRTDGATIALGKYAGSLTTGNTNAPTSTLYQAVIPLPLTLSCANTATGTNSPTYTLYREGTSTSQALATLQVPLRLFAPSGSNFTITAANVCGYRTSGTGVITTWANETNTAYICTT